MRKAMPKSHVRRRAFARGVRPLPGRPRKLTHRRIVDGAVQILEEAGSEALSMRSLAQRLGINHATLYNYFHHLDDIETRAIEVLMTRVPIPSTDNPAPLREQLVGHLRALRDIHLQHPGVLHARVGSPRWRLCAQLQNRLLRVVEPHVRSLAEFVACYKALTALMCSDAERARRIGGDYLELQRQAIWALPQTESELLRRLLADRSLEGPRIDCLGETLNYLIDRLLPDIGQWRHGAKTK